MKVSNVEVVGVDGGILSIRLTGSYEGKPFSQVLITEMDGNYAEWEGGSGPVVVGGPGWEEIVDALDSNEEVVAAVVAYHK